MKYLVIDFETKDPYIQRGLGSGWIYGIKVPSSDFRILGAAVLHGGIKEYLTNELEILELVDKAEYLIMHNAQYDLGCLLYLKHKLNHPIELKDKPLYDTEIMSRLCNSSMMSHSLDALGSKYFNVSKGDKFLSDAVAKYNLSPRKISNEQHRVNFAKKNMDLVQMADLNAMAEYAIQDVIITDKLFKYFQNKLDNELSLKYSMLAHVCISYRLRGVRISIDNAVESHKELSLYVNETLEKAYSIAGTEFSVNSGNQMAEVFDRLDISYPLTDKGNPSIKAEWLEKQEHEICQLILKARKAKKYNNDFLGKIIEMQQYTCPTADRYGRIYPELNLLRARTGRFSCSSPNIQQIPARDKFYGPICRSIFVPEEGETWFSLDYSNQEGRLQVHYAHMLHCPGASDLRNAFIEDPNLDLHQKVADMIGISRTVAKTVNLGLSYGMGHHKLGFSLGISPEQAKYAMEQYKESAPFLSTLDEKVQKAFKSRGYIKTLGGRKLNLDPPTYKFGKKITFEYKGLNKLIQGSAADQIIEAMIIAYKEDLPVLFPVHDQLCLTGTLDQALRLKEIMETCVTLSLPVVVDMDEEGGKNWSEAGH
jgi:DNA polymerase-1